MVVSRRSPWIVRLATSCTLALIVFLALGANFARPQTDTTAAPAKQVLFLLSNGPYFQPWAIWTSEIRDQLNLQSRWPLDIQEHSLVSTLKEGDGADEKFVDYLLALYAQRKPDLIIAIGAPAARFVQKHRGQLFPTTPMLLAAVEARRVDGSMLSTRDTVVSVRVDHAAVFQNILRLLPDTKAVAMVIGNSPGEKIWIRDVQAELKPLLGDRVKLLFYNELPFDGLVEKLASLPPRTAIFFQQLMADGVGNVYGDKQPLQRITQAANAPIFTQDQTFFYGGVVGGPMLSPTEGGRAAAGVAIRILDGESAAGIVTPPNGFATPTYDWRALRRWSISESRLPPGSEVVFLEQTAWQRYPLQISFVALAVLLQTGVIAILLRERQRRHLAEVQARSRMIELAHVNRVSTAGALSASIAHEINQPLGTILSNAEAAMIMLQSSAPDIPAVTETLTEILKSDRHASEVIRRVRSLVKKAPYELQRFDLNELAMETAQFLSRTARGRDIELRSATAPKPVHVIGDRVQLQQVILNLVMNAIDAMQDSESRSIDIETSQAGGMAELSVSDSGPGIPAEKLGDVFEPFYTTKAEGMGMGLSIARTIVESHDGTLAASTGAKGGASFTIRLPAS